MLRYTVHQPSKTGNDYMVVYMPDGSAQQTVCCYCSTEQQAIAEARRLNHQQIKREQAIKDERAARGLGGVYPGLDHE